MLTASVNNNNTKYFFSFKNIASYRRKHVNTSTISYESYLVPIDLITVFIFFMFYACQCGCASLFVFVVVFSKVFLTDIDSIIWLINTRT